MKYGNMVMAVIEALDGFDVVNFEVFDNTIYLDFNTQEQAELIYYHLLFNHEDSFEDLVYDSSRNSTRIRIVLKYRLKESK